jgi:hypothetical protein
MSIWALLCTYEYIVDVCFLWITLISLYSSKSVDKKQILLTVSNTAIYCSSDKVGTVYVV